MGGEAGEQQDKSGAAGGGAGGGAAGGEQPPKPVPPPKAEPPKAGGEQPPPERVRVEGAGDIPSDAKLLELTPKALAARLDRHTSSELKKRFGTDDPEVIAARLKKLDELEAAEEKRRQETLTKEQKLAEERDAANARAEAAERRARTTEENRTYERQDQRMSAVAGRYIDEDHVDVQLNAFARHLTENFSDKQLSRMRTKEMEAEAEKFFKAQVEKKPKIGKDYDAQVREQAKKELKAEQGGKPVKVTNGAGGKGPPPAAGANGEVKPGNLPPKELAEWKRKNNVSW